MILILYDIKLKTFDDVILIHQFSPFSDMLKTKQPINPEWNNRRWQPHESVSCLDWNTETISTAVMTHRFFSFFCCNSTSDCSAMFSLCNSLQPPLSVMSGQAGSYYRPENVQQQMVDHRGGQRKRRRRESSRPWGTIMLWKLQESERVDPENLFL